MLVLVSPRLLQSRGATSHGTLQRWDQVIVLQVPSQGQSRQASPSQVDETLKSRLNSETQERQTARDKEQKKGGREDDQKRGLNGWRDGCTKNKSMYLLLTKPLSVKKQGETE